jgi:hypothetical protein
MCDRSAIVSGVASVLSANSIAGHGAGVVVVRAASVSKVVLGYPHCRVIAPSGGRMVRSLSLGLKEYVVGLDSMAHLSTIGLVVERGTVQAVTLIRRDVGVGQGSL